MTREEAIKHLQAAALMLTTPDNQPVSDLYYAILEGVEALEQYQTWSKTFENFMQQPVQVLTQTDGTAERMVESAQNVPNDDLISRKAAKDTIYRKAAIEAVRAMQTYKLSAGDDMLLVDQAEAMAELMALPSAQPERPIGKWNVYEVANTDEEQPIAWQCPECGEVVEYRYNFCPECGDQKIPLDPTN